ncbi:hypothetical protein [Halolamina sediminis]|nr:hypothetical protein [Halolamina sediminis]
MDKSVQKAIAAGGVTLLMAGRPSGFTLVAAAIVHDLVASALDRVEF